MEYETRFYYQTKDLEKIINILKEIPELHNNFRIYEKTIEYNHPSSEYSFKDINGKFRLRISRNELNNKCKISWKKKINDINGIKVEEEKDVRINPNDTDNLIYLLEKVMHFKLINSYERYRIIFENNDIEIAVDEYPFGICLEIENKSIDKVPVENVNYWIKRIGLDINDAENITRNDKYISLCKEQNVECFKEVSFDKEMPKINNEFKIDNR